MGPLLSVDFGNPLLWAVLIGWLLTVTLHELGHGIVAHLGGDWTIRERGGLSLNPLQYVDPLMSIVLPAVFLLMGGVPLPGAATYIRRDLLRSRVWDSLVSAAGPTTNLLIFLALCVPLHPSVGWIDYSKPPGDWTSPQIFVAALAFLQLFSVFLNLAPIPGIDGFGIIRPWLSSDLQEKLANPALSWMFLVGYFMVLSSAKVQIAIYSAIHQVMSTLGLNFGAVVRAFFLALYGEAF